MQALPGLGTSRLQLAEARSGQCRAGYPKSSSVQMHQRNLVNVWVCELVRLGGHDAESGDQKAQHSSSSSGYDGAAGSMARKGAPGAAAQVVTKVAHIVRLAFWFVNAHGTSDIGVQVRHGCDGILRRRHASLFPRQHQR